MLNTFFTQLKNAILSIDVPWDILDILVVAFIIYQAIKLIRETRAEQLLKGLLAVFVLFAVANLLHLNTTAWLISLVVNYGVLALFVVFQPELRRALEQVGRTQFKGLNAWMGQTEQKTSREALERLAGIVADGAIYCSRRRDGALIVLERETKLGEIIKTGTIIDSEPSLELIGNLFFPNSPLHDGAVIVRGAKIYAAGCLLPLADNQVISRTLGTRHRAALGMSENSDAIVVVVSEETGIISLAKAGRLTRNYNRDSLFAILKKELLPELETEGKGKEKLAGLWKVKK